MQNNSKILEQHRREVKLIFIQFLKKNNVLKKYKENITQLIPSSRWGEKMNPLSCDRLQDRTKGFKIDGTFNYETYFRELINWAFCWRDTPQGHIFWRIIDLRWKEILNDFLKKI